MKYTQLLVVFGVFLTAILLHWFLIRKEYFVTPKKFLTKENVQLWLDTTIFSIVQQYQTTYPTGTPSSDPKVQARAKVLGTMLNNLNNVYPFVRSTIQSYNYSTVQSLRLEDISFVSDLMNTKSDLPTMLSTVKDKLKLLNKKLRLIRDSGVQSMVKSTLSGFGTNIETDISSKYSSYPSDAIPTANDSYLYTVLLTIYTAPVVKSIVGQPIPTLNISNLPTAQTIAEDQAAVDAASKAPPPAPSALPSSSVETSVSAAGPSIPGMGGQKSAPSASLAPVAPLAPVPSAALAPSAPLAPVPSAPLAPLAPVPSAPAPLPTTLPTTQQKKTPVGYSFSELVSQLLRLSPSTSGDVMTTDDLDGLIQEEVASQLDDRGLTNVKDIVNKTIVDRSTKPVLPEVTNAKTNSDSLQQGSWFRGAKDSSYAQGQQGPGSQPSSWFGGASCSQEKPVDMSEYIRKDSIPCYGCTLK